MLDLLEYTVRRAEKQGASQAEAYMHSVSQLRTSIEKGQVKISEKKYDAGVGIRVAVKKRGGMSIGFAYLTNLTREAADSTVKQALRVASFKKPDPNFKSFQEKKRIPAVTKIFDKKVPATEPEEIVSLASDLIKAASIDKRITTIGGGIGAGTAEIALANSLGVSGEFKMTAFGAGAYVVSQEGDSVGVGWDDYTNCFYNEDEAFHAFKQAADLSLRQLHPKTIRTGKMDLLLQPHALAQLSSATLMMEVRADNIQKQQSPFVGKMNQRVASENLTVVDDGTVPQAVGSKPFDDEGCPTHSTPVIEKGVLRGFLYNSYTANKDNVKNTGNAVRTMPFATKPRYAMEPLIGPTNFKLMAGAKSASASLEGVLSEVKSGVIAKEVIGAHTANAPSGEFSVALSCAFNVEKGEIAHPVKQAMVGGNIQDLIKNVALFADDVKQVGLEQGTLISPTILIRNVPVSG